MQKVLHQITKPLRGIAEINNELINQQIELDEERNYLLKGIGKLLYIQQTGNGIFTDPRAKDVTMFAADAGLEAIRRALE